MEIRTHQEINASLCGEVKEIKPGFSRVELLLNSEMAVDQFKLVHGGFIFGLADYAAMVAVNHPNVVLGAAQVKFLKPSIVGETAEAVAQVQESAGKKQEVAVRVTVDETTVFNGTFTCFSLDKHVLTQ